MIILLLFIILWSIFGTVFFPLLWVPYCDEITSEIKIRKVFLISIPFGPITVILVSFYLPFKKYVGPAKFQKWLVK